ncbi:hypothetical protein P8452_29836 [Trifolium repens]|nr:hypothetical protein P8452_29836 [Trifolium repens]
MIDAVEVEQIPSEVDKHCTININDSASDVECRCYILILKFEEQKYSEAILFGGSYVSLIKHSDDITWHPRRVAFCFLNSTYMF